MAKLIDVHINEMERDTYFTLLLNCTGRSPFDHNDDRSDSRKIGQANNSIDSTVNEDIKCKFIITILPLFAGESGISQAVSCHYTCFL